jgi:hypothetical protein
MLVWTVPWNGAARAAPGRLVVAELYTSQGCSACRGADQLSADLEGRKGVLVLTFPVNYWDYLGWRDTFAQPAFSERQKAYAKALGVREVYTPQVVIQGRGLIGKTEPGQSLTQSAQALIAAAAKAHGHGPAIRLERGGRIVVGAGRAPHAGAEVWLVRFEPDPPEVLITAGENSGKTVRYRNVVRELTRLGSWTGRARVFPEPPAGQAGLKTAVLVQVKAGGRILSARASPSAR